MPGNMPSGRLNPAIGFGGEVRRSLCAVRCRDAAIYRRLESVPVDEVGVVVEVVAMALGPIQAAARRSDDLRHSQHFLGRVDGKVLDTPVGVLFM